MQIGMVRKGNQNARKGQKEKSRKEKRSVFHPHSLICEYNAVTS